MKHIENEDGISITKPNIYNDQAIKW